MGEAAGAFFLFRALLWDERVSFPIRIFGEKVRILGIGYRLVKAVEVGGSGVDRLVVPVLRVYGLRLATVDVTRRGDPRHFLSCFTNVIYRRSFEVRSGSIEVPADDVTVPLGVLAGGLVLRRSVRSSEQEEREVVTGHSVFVSFPASVALTRGEGRRNLFAWVRRKFRRELTSGRLLVTLVSSLDLLSRAEGQTVAALVLFVRGVLLVEV